MIQKFSLENVNFEKDISEDTLVISGELTNRSDRDYSCVVFRFVVFAKDSPLCHANITINGFSKGRTRRFEKIIHGLAYSDVINKITGYEAFFEGGY